MERASLWPSGCPPPLPPLGLHPCGDHLLAGLGAWLVHQGSSMVVVLGRHLFCPARLSATSEDHKVHGQLLGQVVWVLLLGGPPGCLLAQGNRPEGGRQGVAAVPGRAHLLNHWVAGGPSWPGRTLHQPTPRGRRACAGGPAEGPVGQWRI
eukprot:599629-Lingulodinium_polyedra.AAC.1